MLRWSGCLAICRRGLNSVILRSSQAMNTMTKSNSERDALNSYTLKTKKRPETQRIFITISVLCQEPAARAALVWMLGEYAEEGFILH